MHQKVSSVLKWSRDDVKIQAKVVSRPPPCDVCHDIHFIYVFDSTGKILQFVPLQFKELYAKGLIYNLLFDRQLNARIGVTPGTEA